jgi:hypothetical protein
MKDSFMFYPEITDNNFSEKLYLKKEFRDTKINESDISEYQQKKKSNEFILDPNQIFLRNYISPDTPYNGILIYHMTGVGKCHKKGTKIIMYDGTIKNVEHIKKDDLLMGDDSTPRTVMSLATGRDKMYDIIYSKNEKYTVNSEHILCLKINNYPELSGLCVKWIYDNQFKENLFNTRKEAIVFYNECLLDNLKNKNIIELSVNDYLKLPSLIKDKLKCYKVPIYFDEKELETDPYLFGIEIIKKKSINHNYKCNSRCNRFNLLRGIINSIGKIINKSVYIKLNNELANNELTNNELANNELTNNELANNENLIEDILFLSRSLGYDSVYDGKKIIIKNYLNMDYDTVKHNSVNSCILKDFKVSYAGYDEYYGFTLDNNCRYLLGDFSVTHNTCTAISIAEGFKKTLKNINKKILVLGNLKSNFIKEIYNFSAEKTKENPEDVVQCTGKEYELGQESLFLTQKQKEKEIQKMIRSYYEFFGYSEFANKIIKDTKGWKGEDDKVDDSVKNFINKYFDDRVIIADEIQNIKTEGQHELSKIIQPILQSIVKYGKNIKLVLMSATPMFDRPDEIIFYLNLLLQNDGRDKINKNDIFNSKDSSLKPGAELILKNAFKGYVSFMRAEKPFVFPFRIYPKNTIVPSYIKYYMSGELIPENKRIKYTKIALSRMHGVQLNTYLYYYEKKLMEGKIKKQNDNINIVEIDETNINSVNNSNKLNGNNKINTNDKPNENNKSQNNNEQTDIDNTNKRLILPELTKISNIVFPVKNMLINNFSNSNNTDKKKKTKNLINKIGSFHKYSIDSELDNGLGGYYKSTKIVGTKKRIKYKYQSHAIFNKDTVNEAPFADEKHLHDYSSKFSEILDNIKKSKGLIFVYSYYIEQGALPFALMLEQNGFDRECVDGEDNLLEYNANSLKKGGKRQFICYKCSNEASNRVHYDTTLKDYHPFKRAKYILFFGKQIDIVKIKKQEALNKFRSNKNKYGEEVKVFIGTKSVSEGLDFQRIRQVHIIDPWYNLSRHEQIIGRAIRKNSHNGLLPEERNVEIYQYAAVLDKDSKYKERETVDLKNYRLAEDKDIIIKSISRILKESAVDCPFFKDLNIVKSNKKVKQITATGEIINIQLSDQPYSTICDYQKNCDYKCDWMPNPRYNYPINTDTYNIKFASNDIEKVKKYIKNLFRENNVYYLKGIENNIKQKYDNIDKIFIYSALEELVNNKNEVIYDKFSRKGYIIYKGDYYIFQPFDLEREELPMIYREYPSSFKPNSVDLEDIDVEYSILNNNVENEVINEKEFIKTFIINIDHTYNEHKDLSIIKNKSYEKQYLLAIIGSCIDKLNINQEILFIKYILKKYILMKLDKNVKQKEKQYDIKYLNEMIEILNINNKLINFYSDIKYDKSKINNNIFVGFIINNEYYIIDSVDKTENIVSTSKTFNFIKCSKEIISKIKYYKDIYKNKKKQKEFNIIYGSISFDKKGFKKFKIVDKSEEEEILTKEKVKSKRSIIKGRICGTYDFKKLNEIRSKLSMYKIDGKRKIEFLCEDIEIFFRLNNILNINNSVWFIEE